MHLATLRASLRIPVALRPSFLAFVWAALVLLGAAQVQQPTEEPAVDLVEVEDGRETEREPTPFDEPRESVPCVTQIGVRGACVGGTSASTLLAVPVATRTTLDRDEPWRLSPAHSQCLLGRSPPPHA